MRIHLAVNKNPATEGIIEEKTANWVSLDDQILLTQQLEVLLAKSGIQSNSTQNLICKQV